MLRRTTDDQDFSQPEPAYPGLRPVPGFARPMILTSMRWFSVARLAHTLVEAGYDVTCCRPADHPLSLVGGTRGQYTLSRLRPLHSLRMAIAAATPDIILPADEQAIALLCALYERARLNDPATTALIRRSLGGVDLDDLKSRTTSLGEMANFGVSCPSTEQVADRHRLASHTLPLVLKTDGSYGGRGVAIVRSEQQLRKAWQILAHPPSVFRAIKRLVIDRESATFEAWLRQAKPVVNVQRFVDGYMAIATAACNDGVVLDVLCMVVVRSSQLYGPATVVGVVDRPDMTEAVKRVVQRFKLSGFVGLDFIVDADDRAQLIEINARVTPTCHLLMEPTTGTIALFPQELLRDPESTFHLDLPTKSGALVRYGLGLVEKRESAFNGMVHRLLKAFQVSSKRSLGQEP